MALVDLEKIKAQLTSTPSEGDQREVFRELLFKILTKAARVDLHTADAEITMIQRIMKSYTGEEYAAAAIRTESIAQSQESSLRPVARLAAKLPESFRVLAIVALEEVMRSDERLSYSEIDYFNAVAGAMRLSFADVAGLVAD
jgi:uncharacterized tellurite resistance protein B-like protein